MNIIGMPNIIALATSFSLVIFNASTIEKLAIAGDIIAEIITKSEISFPGARKNTHNKVAEGNAICLKKRMFRTSLPKDSLSSWAANMPMAIKDNGTVMDAIGARMDDNITVSTWKIIRTNETAAAINTGFNSLMRLSEISGRTKTNINRFVIIMRKAISEMVLGRHSWLIGMPR